MFERSSHFAVNILNQQQQDLSNNYAKKGSHDLEDDHFSNGQTGLPLINNAIAASSVKLTPVMMVVTILLWLVMWLP